MSTPSPTKPHKTYPELVDLLKKRGMIIPDEDRAKRKLSQIGYYRLSGFWYPSRIGQVDANGEYVKDKMTNLPVRENNLQKNTSFTDVTDLYLFDKKLRQLMLDAIERIEIHVRSVIAHELGRFDPLAYKNTDFINPKILKDRIVINTGIVTNFWQDWDNKQKDLTKKSKEDSICWHKKNGRAIPIWVAVETWDFGIMSKYFQNLKGQYQEKICKRLEVPNKMLLTQNPKTLDEEEPALIETIYTYSFCCFFVIYCALTPLLYGEYITIGLFFVWSCFLAYFRRTALYNEDCTWIDDDIYSPRRFLLTTPTLGTIANLCMTIFLVSMAGISS